MFCCKGVFQFPKKEKRREYCRENLLGPVNTVHMLWFTCLNEKENENQNDVFL